MKIIFYINTLCGGGAERVISNLATVFSEHDHECILITSFQSEKEYIVGNKVKRISMYDSRLNCGFFQRNFKLTRKLRKYINSEQPDIVVAFMAEPNFRAIVASLGLKNKVVVSVRNDPDKEYSNKLNRILAKSLYRFADGIVFQTEAAQKWFPKSIQDRSVIILNQVDEIFYHTKFEGERHDIVTTGRLTLQKNHEMLIRAFAMIADKVSDNLIIYGEGELRPKLEDLIETLHMQDRILLPGRIEDVAGTIQSARLFVLSSDYEGMPNALMEAMALGIPCISTDSPCGGAKVLLGDLEDLCLVQVSDIKALSDKMLSLLQDEKKMKKVSHAMLKKSEEFIPNVIFEEWNRYFHK